LLNSTTDQLFPSKLANPLLLILRMAFAIFSDEDVLDTWFSSALWPFGTLGWPEGEKPSPLQGRGLGEGTVNKAPPNSLRLQPPPLTSPLKGRGSLLSRHYPNDVLISGFDILFFWDARMAMQGLHFMKDVPWKTLYLHGLVRAADGSENVQVQGQCGRSAGVD
jgi:valyl-tRNA synthetase